MAQANLLDTAAAAVQTPPVGYRAIYIDGGQCYLMDSDRNIVKVGSNLTLSEILVSGNNAGANDIKNIALIKDGSDTNAVDMNGRILIGPEEAQSVNWGQRGLLDPSGIGSVDWLMRYLVNSSNVQTVEWENLKLLGAWEVGYTPANSGDWSGDPTSLHEAINRIAAVVATLNGGPIP